MSAVTVTVVLVVNPTELDTLMFVVEALPPATVVVVVGHVVVSRVGMAFAAPAATMASKRSRLRILFLITCRGS